MNKKKSAKTKREATFTFYDTKLSLNNWSRLVDVMKRVLSTDLVENDGYLYFKVYYGDNFSTEDRNEVFASISSLPLSENHTFFGVREYLENHEMCFVFEKN